MLIATAPIALARNAALVIGNSVYQGSIQALDNPVNDATDVAAAFKSQGYDVSLVLDANKDQFREALVAFGQKAEGAETAIVYYAGHAVELDGQNYLMPIDAHLADRRSAKLDFVNVSAVIDQISGATKLRMFVLDACRTDPYIQQLKSNGATRGASAEGLASMENEAGVLVAFAAAAGFTTPDGISGGNSPYTTAFLQAFQGPPMDVRRFMGKVRAKMRESVPEARPALYDELGGELYVINPLGDSHLSETKNAAMVGIDTDFQVASAANTLSAWNDFVVRHSAQRNNPVYQTALGKRRALIQQNAPVEVSLPRVIAPAAEPEMGLSDAFKELQQVLKERKCYWGAIDGIYGKGSAGAVRRLAAASGISVSVSGSSTVSEILGAARQLENGSAKSCPVIKKAKAKSKPRRATTPSAPAAAPAPVEQAAPQKQCFFFEGQKICN